MSYPPVAEFRGLNLYRRSHQLALIERLEYVREISNSVRSIRGGGNIAVAHGPSGVTIKGIGGATTAGTSAPATGTAAVLIDWRINSSLEFQVDERVLTGVTISTATNWITKATGGTCAA